MDRRPADDLPDGCGGWLLVAVIVALLILRVAVFA